MRKDRVNLLRVAIKSEESEIIYAECGCPAGMGPTGSCKHIAALAYALVDFSCCKSLPAHIKLQLICYNNGTGPVQDM